MSRLFLLLVAALALVAAGCGGSSSSTSTTTTTETATQETTTTEAASSETTTTEASGSTTSGAFAWASEDCQSLVKAYIGLSAAIGAASTGKDVSGDIKAFAQYTDKVPAEIRDDVKTLAAAYGTYADEIKKMGYKPGEVPTADQLQKLQDASQSLGTSEVQAAGKHLDAWTTKNCTK
jgi:hypothetical protein